MLPARGHAISILDQAKAMAKRLRFALTANAIKVSHAASLEPKRPGSVSFQRAIPILRIFDVTKAREFYCDFLGFTVTMEHRHEPDLPLYMAIERAGLELHLTEHHGDASPGSTVFIWSENIRAYHDELTAKAYGYGRPAIEHLPWGDQLQVHDPFGNRLRFARSGNNHA